MPPKKPAAKAGRDSSGLVLGARPWVHAAYCAALLAVVLGAQLFAPAPPSAATVADGWAGGAGSVGTAQTQCPTWSRPREASKQGSSSSSSSSSPSKGNTVISIDPRCFRNPFLDVHLFDTGLSPG